MDSNNRSRRKKNYKLRRVIFYVVFGLLFTGVTAPLIIFHGPFTNVKKTIVDASMTTLSHQWIAKLFLSDSEIQNIRNEDKVQVAQEDNNKLIKFANTHDNSIERYNIFNGRKYTGYALIIKDPTRVKVGYSKKLGTKGELTSQIAKDNGAVAAINAGGFSDSSSTSTNGTGTGGKPMGIIMSNGIIKFNDIKDPNKKVDITAITKKTQLIVGS